MTKRSTVTLCWFLVLALAGPAMAQTDPAGGEGDPAADGAAGDPADEALGPDDGLPPAPPEAPPPSDDVLKPTASDVKPTAPVLTTGPKRIESKETWKDIVVIPRKPMLKRRRFSLLPYIGTTINDQLIQHTAIGLDANYFLTDILAIGILGHYYFKNVSDQEFFTRYHFNRVPSINTYIWTATLNFSYVPIYGKFAIFNQHILHFEVYATAGIGGSGTRIIPRDYKWREFTNAFTLTIPVGLGGRMFVTKWMAIEVGFRLFLMLDNFEPATRGVTGLPEAEDQALRTNDSNAWFDKEAEYARDNGEGRLIPNMMFNFGVSFYLPPSFKYTTFR